MRIAEILLEQRDPGVIAERYRRRLERRIPSDPTLARLTAGCAGYEGALPPATPEDVVAFIHHCVDPTQRKKYVDWIVRCWIEGHRSRDNSIGISHAEDFGRVRQALDVFDRRQRDLSPDRRDINRVKSLRELEELVAPLARPTERQQRRQRRREIASLDDPANWNWVCRRPDHGVVIPRSHAESCAIAAYPRTHWCTATRDDPGMFRAYRGEEGNLAILVVPGNIRSADEIRELYQLALETLEFRDDRDRSADLLSAWEEWPCLREVLARFRDIRTFEDLVEALPLEELADALEANPEMAARLDEEPLFDVLTLIAHGSNEREGQPTTALEIVQRQPDADDILWSLIHRHVFEKDDLIDMFDSLRDDEVVWLARVMVEAIPDLNAADLARILREVIIMDDESPAVVELVDRAVARNPDVLDIVRTWRNYPSIAHLFIEPASRHAPDRLEKIVESMSTRSLLINLYAEPPASMSDDVRRVLLDELARRLQGGLDEDTYFLVKELVDVFDFEHFDPEIRDQIRRLVS